MRNHPSFAQRHSGIGSLPVLVSLFALLALAAPARARVDVAPWSGNLAFVSTRSEANGVVDSASAAAPSAAPWGTNPFASADNDTTDSHAFSTMTINSSFADSLFAAHSSGFGAVEGPGANHRGGAAAFVWFAVTQTQTYVHYPVLGEGNVPSRSTLAFIANLLAPGAQMIVLSGTETITGRLAPGVYLYFYSNYYGTSTANGSPNAFSSQLRFYDVPDPLVNQHPQSQTVPAGSTASFSVGASGLHTAPAGGPPLTYLWRRGYQPLTNGGRISGATTAQLQIANVAVSDSGNYDCVVTQGVISEPSSLARLDVAGGTTGADGPQAAAGLALAAPAPNPSGGRTRVAFSMPADARVTLDLLDVSGRRVQRLLNEAPYRAGSHALEWDGRNADGHPVRAGMYFVRLEGGGEVRTRRLVRLLP